MTCKTIRSVIVSLTIMAFTAGIVSAQPADGSSAQHMGNGVAVPLVNIDTVKKDSGSVTKKKLVPQKTCPVQGDPIDKSIFVDYKGKRVYFCCAGCPETFMKDPEKYLKFLAKRGESVENVPKKQPAADDNRKTVQ
jgi:YHS domain-containing protein